MIFEKSDPPGTYLLGLVGPAGSGKSHVATVAGNFPNVYVFPLATGIRAWFRETFPELRDLNSASSASRSMPRADLGGRSWRDIAIAYGLAMRTVIPDFFVRQLLRRIEDERLELLWGTVRNLVIVPDVRFMNEVVAFEKLNGNVIGVVHTPSVPDSAWNLEQTNDTMQLSLLSERTGTALHRRYGELLPDWENEMHLNRAIQALRDLGRWNPMPARTGNPQS